METSCRRNWPGGRVGPAKIREARTSLEAEAKEQAKAKAAAALAKMAEPAQETGKKTGGRFPQVVNVEEAKPDRAARAQLHRPGIAYHERRGMRRLRAIIQLSDSRR